MHYSWEKEVPVLFYYFAKAQTLSLERESNLALLAVLVSLILISLYSLESTVIRRNYYFKV
jgi:hypothetical protein